MKCANCGYFSLGFFCEICESMITPCENNTIEPFLSVQSMIWVEKEFRNGFRTLKKKPNSTFILKQIRVQNSNVFQYPMAAIPSPFNEKFCFLLSKLFNLDQKPIFLNCSFSKKAKFGNFKDRFDREIFWFERPVFPKTVTLIDDLLTTGSTLSLIAAEFPSTQFHVVTFGKSPISKFGPKDWFSGTMVR